jgi:hypothetical protein
MNERSSLSSQASKSLPPSLTSLSKYYAAPKITIFGTRNLARTADRVSGMIKDRMVSGPHAEPCHDECVAQYLAETLLYQIANETTRSAVVKAKLVWAKASMFIQPRQSPIDLHT